MKHIKKYEGVADKYAKKKWAWKNDFEYCYTLYTNEFDKATPEEIARDKYNL